MPADTNKNCLLPTKSDPFVQADNLKLAVFGRQEKRRFFVLLISGVFLHLISGCFFLLMSERFVTPLTSANLFELFTSGSFFVMLI